MLETIFNFKFSAFSTFLELAQKIRKNRKKDKKVAVNYVVYQHMHRLIIVVCKHAVAFIVYTITWLPESNRKIAIVFK